MALWAAEWQWLENKASISLKMEEMTKSRGVITQERLCPVGHKHTRGIPELG